MHVVIEVDVGVHEAGHDDVVAGVEHATRPVRALNVGALADGHDSVAGDGQRAVANDPSRGIHGHE